MISRCRWRWAKSEGTFRCSNNDFCNLVRFLTVTNLDGHSVLLRGRYSKYFESGFGVILGTAALQTHQNFVKLGRADPGDARFLGSVGGSVLLDIWAFSSNLRSQYHPTFCVAHEDYMVLCHAWLPPSRHQVNAAVHWLGRLQHKPSVVSLGRQSQTSVMVAQHLAHNDLACSFVQLEILTGRRHQIRLHMAHLACPVVGDGKYSSIPSQMADAQWCGHHFLHRCSLTFLTASFQSKLEGAPVKRVQAFQELPLELKHVICSLRVVRNFTGEAEDALASEKVKRSCRGVCRIFF